MAELVVVYWRDIPAQVIARVGRRTAKRQLSGRFSEAIDRAAMRAKLHDTDSYLAHWRRGAAEACDDDLEAAAESAASALEAAYSDARLADLIKGGGAADTDTP